MIGLLLPFLVVDLILGWMVVDTWRGKEVWLVTRMGRKDENRGIWWFSLLRLVGLLGLSLAGTVAVLRA
ncbi:MAG TPA: hypothetical protein VF592_07570 [Sphingomonas sp.]|jgi:hypothetical protein|uniref:hypothetical protein n=1 Tax=Sphingomonas sp. TaxID=28214 RepID=UPI002EDA3085